MGTVPTVNLIQCSADTDRYPLPVVRDVLCYYYLVTLSQTARTNMIALQSTVASYMGRRVFLVLTCPEIGFFLPDYITELTYCSTQQHIA